VCPAGWTTRTVPIQDFLKDSLADEFVLEGTQSDDLKPHITISRGGPETSRQNKNVFQPDWGKDDGYTHIQFQGQPAVVRFLNGYGKRQAVRGSYQPWLLQELLFERDGQWFRLSFDMRNADKDKPYYTQPLPIIQQYFETFRYKLPGK
jgi:hypothetical protein